VVVGLRADDYVRGMSIPSSVRRVVAATTVALSLSAGLVACGSDEADEPSAADQVCAARSDLDDAIAVVVDDLKSANFGDAKDSVAGVSAAADTLKGAVGDLASEQRDAIQPQTDALSSAVTAIGDASSLPELQAAMSSLSTAVSAWADAAASDLDC
jgi:hypothetical protein